MLYQSIDACRACGSEQIPEVLNLGEFFISDFEDSPDAFTDKAPLVLVRCAECTLVQLRHTVDRDRLYRRYWYRSGTQPAMVSALQDVVRDVSARANLLQSDVVIDIGANDGTLLRQYPEGIKRIAYEPAENLWPALRGNSWDASREIASIYGYFPQVVNGEVVGMDPPAKIITSIACFYDVDNPGQFVDGIRRCLAPGGLWLNQMSYWPHTVKTGNFGDICHEHLTYWNFEAFEELVWRHGLAIEDASLNDVNGGSIRIGVRHPDALSQYMLSMGSGDEEDRLFILRHRIAQQREDVVDWLRLCKADGVKVVGYGASTKGNTYLQYWNVGPDLLPVIADRNPDKWGKYTPTGQLVISEAEARDMQPDFFFLLPWHFKEAFVAREHRFLASGGAFAVPFPNLHFVRGGDPHADLPKEEALADRSALI